MQSSVFADGNQGYKFRLIKHDFARIRDHPGKTQLPVSLIDWISDTFSQGYTSLQSLQSKQVAVSQTATCL